jgi:hypothetical protein
MRVHRSRTYAMAFMAALAVPASDARAGGPFTPLAGNWTGRGTIIMPGGAQERIRCRASYVVSSAGDALSQVLRCASDSFIVNVDSEVTEQSGELSGSWTETTRGATGNLSGEVRGPVIRGTIAGLGFTAALSLVTRGRTQFVSITLEGGSDIAGVVVTFHRA